MINNINKDETLIGSLIDSSSKAHEFRRQAGGLVGFEMHRQEPSCQ